MRFPFENLSIICYKNLICHGSIYLVENKSRHDEDLKVSFPQWKYRHGSDCHRIDTSRFPVSQSRQHLTPGTIIGNEMGATVLPHCLTIQSIRPKTSSPTLPTRPITNSPQPTRPTSLTSSPTISSQLAPRFCQLASLLRLSTLGL